MMKKLLFPLITLGLSVSAQIPTNGLVHAFTFKNQNANDEIGSINGVVNGCALTTDRFGRSNNAYSFDGISNQIDLGVSSNLMTSTGSISIWVKRGGNAGTNKNLTYDPIFVAKNLSTAAYFEGAAMGVVRATGNWISINTMNSTEIVNSKGSIPDNEWQHLVLAYDNDSSRFFINGILAGKKAKGFTSQFSTTLKTYLGYSGNTSYTGYFKGILDDIRIYNKVLSKEEILALYNEVADNTNPNCAQEIAYNHPNLTHQYSFNCGNLVDAKGAMDGTGTNATFTADRFGNFGQALSLNGTNAMVNLGVSSQLMPVTGSISIWAKKSANAATNSNLPYDPIFVSKNLSTAAYFEAAALGVIRSNGNWISINTLNSTEIVNSKSGLSNGEWHHLVLAYDMDSSRLYIDGTLAEKKVKGFNSQFSTTAPVYLGYSGSNTYLGYFSGVLDDLLIFNKVLTSAEVDELFNLNNPLTSSQDSQNMSLKDSEIAYPNPTKGLIHVNGFAEVFDLRGQKVTEGIDNINISALPNGIYVLKNQNLSVKIVKE